MGRENGCAAAGRPSAPADARGGFLGNVGDAEGIRFSVVIPVYCGAATIRRALASAVRQTWPPQEIIVIDDGSPDDTAEVVRRFGRDCRPASEVPVRLIRQPNRGAGAARNAGIREARGNWVAFLDDDDLWLETKLEKQREAILATPGCEWCITGFHVHVDGVYRGPTSPDLARIERLYRYRNPFGPASCYAASKASLLAVNGFREDFGSATCEDWELAVRLYRRFRLAIIKEPLVEYYDTADGGSRRARAVLEAEQKILGTLLEGSTGYRRRIERRLIMACSLARAARNSPAGRWARIGLAIRSLLYWPFPSPAGPRVRIILAAARDYLRLTRRPPTR